MTPSVQSQAPGGKIEYFSQGLRARFQLDAQNIDSRPGDVGQVYADISYEPDEAKWQVRSQAILKAGGQPSSVPGGWPDSVEGPRVWTSSDFIDEQEYVIQIGEPEKLELKAALDHFNEQGLNGEEVSKENFPLPKLGERLVQAAKDVYQGRGFVIVRGLNPENFQVADFTVMFLGISSYIAERRGKQDQRGSMLVHVIEKEKGMPHTHIKPFHTDMVCDCLGLMTLSCSAKGGRSILSSFWTVYNELAKTRPDILHVLAKPDWPLDTLGRNPEFYRRALLYYQDGKPIINVSRRRLVGHPPSDPRTPGIPGLTEAQAEALDALHFIAEKHEIRPSMEKGDMRFINNMFILHRREDFENDDENERHLVRLWLNNEDQCWKLPAPLRLAWARVFEDHDRKPHWDLEPVTRDDKMRLRPDTGSCD